MCLNLTRLLKDSADVHIQFLLIKRGAGAKDSPFSRREFSALLNL